MVKKFVKSNEEVKEESLLDFLIRVAKSVTRLDIKKAGFLGDRKTLRELERAKLVKKTTNYAHNTTKKDSRGNIQLGTRFYTYEAVK